MQVSRKEKSDKPAKDACRLMNSGSDMHNLKHWSAASLTFPTRTTAYELIGSKMSNRSQSGFHPLYIAEEDTAKLSKDLDPITDPGGKSTVAPFVLEHFADVCVGQTNELGKLAVMNPVSLLCESQG
jgi:hypothetical protein